MRILSISRLLAFSLALFTILSCNDKEELATEPLSAYMPLTVGKYITYRLDSMVFTNFGRTTEIHKYQVKHVINDLITDNLGRPGYRVFVYIRDSAGTQPWQPAGNTYTITALPNQIEVNENNLRVIKLHAPTRDGFTWKGNSYLPGDPYGSLFNFSNDDNMEDWNFYYNGPPSSFSYKNMNYPDVYSIEEDDESINVPIVSTGSYAARTRAVERYSKNTGLVYRELEIWEYQPNTGGQGGPYKVGFGITMWMIDHN